MHTPDPQLDRANVVVLVVISVLVAVGIILLAVLATNGMGPNLDELEGAASPRPATATVEVDGGW